MFSDASIQPVVWRSHHGVSPWLPGAVHAEFGDYSCVRRRGSPAGNLMLARLLVTVRFLFASRTDWYGRAEGQFGQQSADPRRVFRARQVRAAIQSPSTSPAIITGSLCRSRWPGCRGAGLLRLAGAANYAAVNREGTKESPSFILGQCAHGGRRRTRAAEICRARPLGARSSLGGDFTLRSTSPQGGRGRR